MTKRRHPLDGLDDEIRNHIERETRDNIECGMDPADRFERCGEIQGSRRWRC